jgi:hypothetical protein
VKHKATLTVEVYFDSYDSAETEQLTWRIYDAFDILNLPHEVQVEKREIHVEETKNV